MSLLNIGVSGLNVNQTSLTVTGNNIANADKPEYTRQRADIVTSPEQFTGQGFIGTGANVQTIERLVEQFLVDQIRLDTSNSSATSIIKNNIEQLDALLSNDIGGVGPLMEAFYESIAASAANPSSVASRQVVLASAERMAQQFNTLYSRVNQQNVNLNSQFETIAEQVTVLAREIAALNLSIEESIAIGQGSTPNQLLDQRDELVRQLSEFTGIRTTTDDAGSINVFIGSGQPLVVRGESYGMSTRASATPPDSRDILFVGPNNSTQVITEQLQGGKLGGLLEFRDGVLSEVFNSLGMIGITVASTINEQQLKGLDLEGNFGTLVFRDINDPSIIAKRSRADVNNSAGSLSTAAQVTIDPDRLSELTTSDYRLQFDGTNYNVVRESDGSVVGTQTGALPVSITTTDGFNVDVAGGTMAAGDTFYLKPTRNGAEDLDVVLGQPQGLAFAGAISTQASSGNRGSGEVSVGEVLNVYDSSGAVLPEWTSAAGVPVGLAQPLMVRFDTPLSYSIYDNSDPAAPVLIAGGQPFTPGVTETVTIGTPPDEAFRFDITGFPETGDEFSVAFNTNASLDNRNAQAISNTRTADILYGGKASVEDANNLLIASVGSKTAQARIASEAAQSLLTQTQFSRDSKSGVNLDEEAANLILFQQGYNASAQIVNVAREIFNTLLAAFN